MKLIIIRHGDPDYSIDSLTPTGWREAELLADRISKLDVKRVEKVEDIVTVGDEVLVKVTEIDEQGRINLSRRDALIQVEGLTPEAPAPREESERPAPRQGGFRRRDNRRRED